MFAVVLVAPEFCCTERIDFGRKQLPLPSRTGNRSHDANALALSPTTRTMQAASPTRFSAWVDFIMYFPCETGNFKNAALPRPNFWPHRKTRDVPQH